MSLYFDPLWVVTAYYNPVGYNRRLQNFKAFRRQLNAPLMVVELARPGRHQLSKGDAEIVLSLTGEDRIWQKERLLNLGIAELPRHVEYVAWVDCDVIFDSNNWQDMAKSRLDKNGGLLQLFETVIHLRKELDASSITQDVCRYEAPIMTAVSAASAIKLSTFDDNEARVNRARATLEDGSYYMAVDRHNCYGMAWSALRTTIEKCGQYDRNIIGGADSVQIFAALSRLDDFWPFRAHTERHRQDAASWAKRAESVGLFASIDFVPQNLYHLWHGNSSNRNYRGRYEILLRHGFDPARDITIAENGTWRWTDPQGALAQDVEAYFFARREDGA